MTEVGPVSYPCPQRPNLLHVMENAYIAEIVDPQTGQPAAPGTAGELVLTTLGRTGSPLLRYRTGDLVKAAMGSPCTCGSHEMGLEGGILARTDDMVTVRGVNVYPSAVDQIIRGCEGVSEYRVEIRPGPGMTELAVLIEPSATDADPEHLVMTIEKALRDALALRVPVMTVPAGALPRFEMKAKRWVRFEAA
jgi:phenylacetate-CoA ligase